MAFQNLKINWLAHLMSRVGQNACERPMSSNTPLVWWENLLQDLTFSQNTGIYGPEKTPYLDTFHKVKINKVKQN